MRREASVSIRVSDFSQQHALGVFCGCRSSRCRWNSNAGFSILPSVSRMTEIQIPESFRSFPCSSLNHHREMSIARIVRLDAPLTLTLRRVILPQGSSRAAARRAVHIQSFPPSSAPEILNKQRLLRPTSPHLTIYQPQVTSILSIGNRFTGAALSALLYGFSLAYLFAPTAFNSVHVVDFVTGLPDAAKYAGKFILAAPFAFHSLNGVRHLAWDMGKFATIPGVYQTGYAVMIGTVISTVALVLS